MITTSAALALTFASAGAHAQMPSISDVVSDVSSSVTTIGRWFDHRPYEPATGRNSPIGEDVPLIGLDFGLEAALVAMPPGGLSLGGSAITLPVLPLFPGSSIIAARLVAHKGIGPRVDIGVSGLYFPSLLTGGMFGFWSVGGDIKAVVWHQEEGPTFAVRVGYSYGYMGVTTTDSSSIPATTLTSTISFRTHTLTPAVLVSRRLSFADPYLGLAYPLTYGGAYLDITAAGLVNDTAASSSLTTVGQGLLVFLGVALTVPGIRLSITPEMTFDLLQLAKAYSFGVKTGVAF